MNTPRVDHAIRAINPDAKFAVFDGFGSDSINTCTIEWHEGTAEISKSDIKAKLIELEAEYNAQDYARKRQEEYPPMEDYLDGIVKDDQAQIDKYIADCKAVKEKYSK